MRTSRKLTILVASFVLLGAACGSSTKESSTLSGHATVLAASSLTNAFTGLGREFEVANPGTKLDFGFGASSELETQIEQGAPTDALPPPTSPTWTRWLPRI